MKKAESFVDALRILRGDVDAIKGAAENAVVVAMKAFADGAAKDARVLLNKPHWLLSRAVSSRVIQYEDTGKVVALVGFKRTTSGRKRKLGTPDPGIYAKHYIYVQYYGRRHDVDADFLDNAMERNEASIAGNVAKAFTRNVKLVATGRRLDDAGIEKR